MHVLFLLNDFLFSNSENRAQIGETSLSADMLFSPWIFLAAFIFCLLLNFAVSVHPCLEGIAHEYYGRFKPTLDHEQEFIETDMERAPQQCVSVDGTFCGVCHIMVYCGCGICHVEHL